MTASANQPAPSIVITSDPERILNLVYEGKKILVQTWISPVPIMEHAVARFIGMTKEEALASGMSIAEIHSKVMTPLKANGGSMHMGDQQTPPMELILKYEASEGFVPDVMVFFLAADMVDKALEAEPELIGKHLYKTGDGGTDVWSMATHDGSAYKH